ncbi:MrcB family domain-containing protein [Oceanimonas sp. CAM02]|uniref:MrcB family domain-containing protein n=1 Tax=Oceanimonas sp. CAM02 TaxID=3080336 RepID=UPI00293559FC|nr:DUF3578 domain-containing protein [Oceanimonas sp. CAM02]MDV2857722.1 DUF3578 domain-containing protein [Oceanimonas sp. CAM02]
MGLTNLFKRVLEGWPQAKNEQYSGHPIANLIRNDLLEYVNKILSDVGGEYITKSSAGTGSWAEVPWLSILNPSITTSTQSGIYPVYLFRADGTGAYLSLGFGTADLKDKYGTKGAKGKAGELKLKVLDRDGRLKNWDSVVDLKAKTNRAKSYEWASVGAKFYHVDNMPSEEELISDLKELLDIYSFISDVLEENKSDSQVVSQRFSKPFILLAGISGTGKTRFVREQAKATGSIEETYCLTSVRPDWHEPSDLLGYISRLGEQPQYIATDVLRFIVKAWKEIIEEIIFENGEPADWRGRKLAEIRPFWLCLDEMNLAPVEQYFSDYLSILETREWKEPEPESKLDYYYDCDPLIKGELFSSLDSGHKQGFEKPSNLLAKDLGLDLTADPDKDIWAYFLKYGIAIPFNLIVAGTVNMDETTHGFSRKVIDRALSFDFGEFFPNDYNEFFLPQTSHKALSYPIWSQANKADLADTIDPDGTKTVAFLTAVNKVLKNTPFELAYRALNELLLAVVSTQPQDDLTLKAVWDDFMMCKVLPRIEGDSDKLTTANGKALLAELNAVLAEQLMPIWQAEENDANQRPDLYREKIAGTTDEEKVLSIPCRSKSKLKWMSDRLASATFTSFWP